jgi:3-oxoacyl-[acyl-carrier-protein] synthase-3
MRYDDLFIAGLGSYLPKAVPVEDAIVQGRYDREDQDSSGLVSITVAGPDDSQPGMAAAAGRVALERSGYRGADISLLLHAVTAYNGLDGWNAGCYLQQEVLGGHGLSFEIRQLSNGAVASIELAAAYLAAGQGNGAGQAGAAAMITAADQFAEPAWDRWRTSWGLVYADGASAAVVSRNGGFARVRSAVTVTDPGLEGLHRGALPFGPSPDASEYPIDFRARSLDFSQSVDIAVATSRISAGLVTAVITAAAEADLDVTAADHYIVPSFGRELLRQQCLDVLGIGIERSTWGWGAAVGHMGAADQFASLTYLSEAGRLNPGDRALIIGIGGGFNWSCVVLDIIDYPPWAY